MKPYFLFILFVFLASLTFSKERISSADSITVNQKLDRAHKSIYTSISESKSHCDSAWQIIANKEEAIMHVRYYNTASQINRSKGEYENAQKDLLSAIRILEKLGMKSKMAILYNNMGNLFYEISKYTEAEKFFQHALNIRQEIKDTLGLAGTYNNIGLIRHEQKKYREALSYYRKALQYNSLDSEPVKKANSFLNSGRAYKELGLVDSAITCYRAATKIYTATEDNDGVAKTLTNIAELLKNTGKYKEAIKILDSAMIWVWKSEVAENRFNVYSGYANSYYNLKEFKKAFDYKLMADNLNDSINSEQAQYRVSQLEKLYETEKKEGEIKDLNKQNEINNAKIEKQRIVAYLLMGIVIIIAIFTILQMRAAKRIKKSRAQLQIQKELIEEQKIQVDEAYHKLHESNKEVLDSIHYAARIQRSLITSERYIKKELGRMNKG